MLEYREFAPVPALAPVVERLWTLAGEAADLGGATQPVLPDGRPELVVHLGDPFDRIDVDGVVTRQPAVLFAGQLRHRLLLRPSGVIAVVGIRFHPFGAAAVLRQPQHQLVGATLGAEALGAALLRELEGVRDAQPALATARARVQEILLRHLDVSRVDPRVIHAALKLTAAPSLAVERIARDVGLTRRHLERKFLDQVGLSPKRLARIGRFSRAVEALECADVTRRGALASVAHDYADQAHFIREFHDLAGCAPGRHLLERGELTGFFARRRR